MAPLVAIFLLLLSAFSFGYARRLGECDIARELHNQGLSRSSLADCKYNFFNFFYTFSGTNSNSNLVCIVFNRPDGWPSIVTHI